VVHFLDVRLDLYTGKYKPFNKPNNNPTYAHIKSNHPPSILHNIPDSINRRLSSISSDTTSFAECTLLYQEALKKSGYSHELKFQQQTRENHPNKTNRWKPIIWFNLPYSCYVATNVDKEFLRIAREKFPHNHALSKIFNNKTLKVSYSYMKNVQSVINQHNKKLLHQQENANNPCNCRNKNLCPLNGDCRSISLIYQATITSNNHTETYV